MADPIIETTLAFATNKLNSAGSMGSIKNSAFVPNCSAMWATEKTTIQDYTTPFPVVNPYLFQVRTAYLLCRLLFLIEIEDPSLPPGVGVLIVLNTQQFGRGGPDHSINS